jgi:Ca2+-binding RTX toxin-like protein
MATTVSLPGASSTTITETYAAAGSATLAQAIANTLTSLLNSGSLTISTVAGGGTPPASTAGKTNELVITSAGTVSVPAGYGAVVDGSGGGSLNVTGGTSFVGGSGNIVYTAAASTTGGEVAVGDGNDTINEGAGSTYTVAGGTGVDLYNLAGTGVVSLGGGNNTVSVTGGADTVFAAPQSYLTNVINQGGNVTFIDGNSSVTALAIVQNIKGSMTVQGGANDYIYYAASASASGSLLEAGTGNETIYGVASGQNDTLWGGFSAGSNDLLWAGSGNDYLLAGAGNDTLIGSGTDGHTGNDTFGFINANVIQAIFGTPAAAKTDLIFNSHPGDVLALTGYDTLYGAAGSHAAAQAVQATLNAASGATSLTLKDGTTISFMGGGPNGITVISS